MENRYKGYWGLLDSRQLATLRKELRGHIYTDARRKQAAFAGKLSEILSDMPEDAVVYYADGVHPTHNSCSTYAWTGKGTRLEQPTVYSLNLNLIERLWKFLRKKVINTGFYRTKEKFRQAVKDFFDNIEKYKEELEALLTLRFRLCNSQTISF